MNNHKKPVVAIVDYGVGNLCSITNVCEKVGFEVKITVTKKELFEADAVILPGVGSFGSAMEHLHKLGLISVLQKLASSSKPLVGICLGMHLLMEESYELGHHYGLGVIKGGVVPFDSPVDTSGKPLKVPHISWNYVYRANSDSEKDSWSSTMLNGLENGDCLYFVHSFYVKPDNADINLSMTRYGNICFCSSIQYRNIFACQFHPERSGQKGIMMFENLVSIIKNRR